MNVDQPPSAYGEQVFSAIRSLDQFKLPDADFSTHIRILNCNENGSAFCFAEQLRIAVELFSATESLKILSRSRVKFSDKRRTSLKNCPRDRVHHRERNPGHRFSQFQAQFNHSSADKPTSREAISSTPDASSQFYGFLNFSPFSATPIAASASGAITA